MPKSTFYRQNKPAAVKEKQARAPHPNELSLEEKQRVLSVLHEEQFMDKAAAQVYASLLDRGIYLCSIRTMYRILQQNQELRERRNVLRHPKYKKPELLATKPNQVWSWDITKLRGPAKWTSYYLYVMMDIYSRYVVGWLVAPTQNAELAEELITDCCWKQAIDENELSIHSDRGSPMTSKAVALLLSDLGVTKTLSRPHVSNDNPYSEAQFKTLKYRPEFPQNFGSIEDARAFCRVFFEWYNNEHYHSGIALMTPAIVHYGKDRQCTLNRQAALDKAYNANPARFKRRPKALILPQEVWINKPEIKEAAVENATIYSIALQTV